MRFFTNFWLFLTWLWDITVNKLCDSLYFFWMYPDFHKYPITLCDIFIINIVMFLLLRKKIVRLFRKRLAWKIKRKRKKYQRYDPSLFPVDVRALSKEKKEELTTFLADSRAELDGLKEGLLDKVHELIPEGEIVKMPVGRKPYFLEVMDYLIIETMERDMIHLRDKNNGNVFDVSYKELYTMDFIAAVTALVDFKSK